nr:hypothetical protein [uncultured Cohaesibacter sp.]
MTDGPDEGYEAYFDTDGDSTTDFTLELESSDTSKYEYVSRFYQENADGSTDYDTLGVLGVTTHR